MSLQDLLYLLCLLLVLGLPVTLALWWGDRIAEAWDRRKLRRRQRRRTPLPRVLPGQDELLSAVQAAERRCEDIDLQISERLLGLQRLTVNAWRQRRSGAGADLLKPAEALASQSVRKEEALGFLLDVACLQSDRIDAMDAEVDALSQALDRIPPVGAPRQGDPLAQSQPGNSPSDQLLKKIEQAGRRRRSIDERLKQMKSWKPLPNAAASQPPPADAGPKGSRFDMTVQ